MKPTPEDHLARAMAATSPAARGRHARLGLATRAPLNRTTHAMLLRQLYMAHFESRRFRKAYDVAIQVLSLRVLVDVAHQDAARAAMALGFTDDAIGHLRLAARRGPANRRAFHHWTLGSALFLAGRASEAASALDRAARWGTTERPLYQAHAALARLVLGEGAAAARGAYDRLERAPCGQGYGRFVLGMLAARLRKTTEARKHLEAFVRRTVAARPAMATALAGEVTAARAALDELRVTNLGSPP